MAEQFSLKPGVTIFYDDVSDLKVVGDAVVEIDEENATPKTVTAIMQGVLVKVKASKSTKKEEKKEEK